MRKKLVIAGLLAAAVLPIVGCSTQIPAGQTAVMVEDYAFIPTAPELIGCQNPETSQFNPPGGYKTYLYPTRQISYEMTGARDQNGNLVAEAEAPIAVANAESPAEMRVPIEITFDMTSDCNALQEFHREIGTKYSGWLNEDGTTSQGYLDMLRYVVGQPAEQTVIQVGQKYPWRKIWNDETVRVEFVNELRKRLPEISKQRTNGKEFFTNFQVTVGKPTPVDANLTKSITDEQAALAQAKAKETTAVADAAAAKAKADADLDTSKSQTLIAEEQAKQRAAEIAGFPSEEAWKTKLGIDAGFNPWPAPVIVGVPGPGGGAPVQAPR